MIAHVFKTMIVDDDFKTNANSLQKKKRQRTN